ncbi:MAG: glutathione S-transferase [Gammaproteobacteria bacterium]|nr:glutathione S-transferase [Gammaproteobacteria bacterium]
MESASEHPVLYSFRRCPYAMRARMALKVSGQACELREVELKHKPQAMIDASPKATVPVLVLEDGTVIDQSLDIMLWALRKNDPENWLSPENGSLDDMLALISETESKTDDNFKFHLDHYKYPTRYGGADAREHRQLAAAYLIVLDQKLENSKFLFGDRLSFADVAIFPFVRQIANTDRAWFDTQAWQKLITWLDVLIGSVLFKTIMQKYSPWQDGDPVTFFPLS